VALPGPQGDGRLPNICPLDVADVVAGEPDAEVAGDDPPDEDELALELDEELLPRPLLHATPTSASTTSALNPRNHRRL
jgi:hypothetical protein